MIAYTDYPITALGDMPGEIAPIRECIVTSYDGNKYCVIEVEGHGMQVKAGYLYQHPGRLGEAPPLTYEMLAMLPETP